MHKKLFLALVVGTLLSFSGTAVIAAEGDKAMASEQVAEKKEKKKKVCKKIKDTGTNILRRVCKSQAEWDEILGKPDSGKGA